MGMPEDEEDVPDHYYCEKCVSEDHVETLEALKRGEKIWEARQRIYASEKKMSKSRKGKQGPPGWLKKDIQPTEGGGEDVENEPQAEDVKAEAETGSKRKREPEVKEEIAQAEDAEHEKPMRGSRQDKRRKSAAIASEVALDTDTALVDIDKLPSDRQKIAVALSKIVADDVQARVKAGTFRIPDGHTAKSLADHHASRIEYSLTMNHEGPGNPPYMAQFRTLNANLKKNKVLIERLLQKSLTADELSTMSSSDMASEELQKERAAMKEALDRQAVAVEVEGPRYRRTHKGDELIEDENEHFEQSSATAQPVRERQSAADAETETGVAASPTNSGPAVSPTQTEAQPLIVDTKRRQSNAGLDRRTSSQQFDMSSIWAKTAQSPTQGSAGPRPMQMPPRRRSSVAQQLPQDQVDGTKDDADVDRMLQDADDDDETYSPAADYTSGNSGGDASIVWRGKLVQSGDGASPTVNARFVAGRDLTPTISWRDLLADRLAIDGRLQVARAEEYLCSLQWSQSSDVSVLALTPYDNAEGFSAVFEYFASRSRYAVVNKDKPGMVKDLYIIPVNAGAELPEHVGMLEYCAIRRPVEEKLLLATFVVARAPGTPPVRSGSQQQEQAAGDAQPSQLRMEQSVQARMPALQAMNGQGMPQHIRTSGAGPAGSPLNAGGATFSPSNSNSGAANAPPQAGYGAVPPPNPYGQQQPTQADTYAGSQGLQSHPNPLVNEILGGLQYAPTALQIINADPNIPREKLKHLKVIMEGDPNTRTDIGALAEKLFEK